VLDQALLVAVERDDADRLRCRNSKANCRKTVHRRRLLSLQIAFSSLLKNLEIESFLILAGRCRGGVVELDVIF
jgi:hypothetical protein